MEAVHLSGGTQSSRAGRHRHQVDRDAAKMPKRAASRDERAGRGVGAARSTETNTERQLEARRKNPGARAEASGCARLVRAPCRHAQLAAGCCCCWHAHASATGTRRNSRPAVQRTEAHYAEAASRTPPTLPLSPRASPIESTQSQRRELRSQEPESACSDLTLRSPAVLSGGDIRRRGTKEAAAAARCAQGETAWSQDSARTARQGSSEAGSRQSQWLRCTPPPRVRDVWHA